jgi:hypothetical protein
MGTKPARFRTFVWWLLCAALAFVINLIAAAIVRQPPFTDWAYIAMQSLLLPAALIFVFKWLLFRDKG